MVNCEFDGRSVSVASLPRNVRSSPSFLSRHWLTAVSSVLLLAGAAAQADSDNVVERGRYLALAGNCATCHTAEGGEAFAGGLPFATP